MMILQRRFGIMKKSVRRKMVLLPIHVVRCIEKIAKTKKMSFEDATIFLLERVLAPTE